MSFLSPISIKPEFRRLLNPDTFPTVSIKNFSVLAPVEAEGNEDETDPGLSQLKTKIGTGAVICLSSELFPIDRNNWYVPAWLV